MSVRSGRFGKYGDVKRKTKLRKNISLLSNRTRDRVASGRSLVLQRHKTEGGGKK